MDAKARVLEDPRLVKKEIGGRTWNLWLNRRGFRIAKNEYGYDAQNPPEEDEIDKVLRLLWIAALPFEPELSFDDFEMMFLAQDYAALVEAAQEINAKQTPEREGEEEKK